MSTDSDPPTDDELVRELVRDELEQMLEEADIDLDDLPQKKGTSRRDVLKAAGLAGAAGLTGAAGMNSATEPASAGSSSAGDWGTKDEPGDFFSEDHFAVDQASGGLTTPPTGFVNFGFESGTPRYLDDAGNVRDLTPFTDGDADGVYTLPNAGDGIDVGPSSAESLSDIVFVEQFSGATLAQKLENAITAHGSATYHIPHDNDGAVWGWDKSVTVSQNYIEIIGTKRVDIDYTLGSASGPLLKLTGTRQYVEGLSFQASGTETPDHGIFLNGTGEQEAVDCFVADASVGFEMGGWKSRLHGCRTNNTASDAFLISGPNNAMTRCFAKNAGQDGIHVNSAHAPTIFYCSSDSSTRYACNIENGVNGYTVAGLTVEDGQTGGTSTDALVNLADNGTSGLYAGGFLDDKANTRQGFNIFGGNHIIAGTRMLSIDGDNFRLASTSSTGRLGVQHPYVHVYGTDPANISWVDDSTDAELLLEGSRILKHNLSGITGTFTGQVRVDDGMNTAGGGLPCRWTGSAWQPSDGSATFT